MKSTITALVAFTSLTSAHFNLNFPAARGFDEDKLTTFPCGGQDTVSASRTAWPLTGGQIALTMGHIDANVEVLIALGNDPGSAFNTVLVPTFKETGFGDFCLSSVTLPEGLNITEGTNATIQVVTNGDPDGGLYNCADITFSASAVAATADVCKNGTGVSVGPATVSGNPNGTSTTESAPAATTSKPSAANALQAGAGALMVAAAAAFAMLL